MDAATHMDLVRQRAALNSLGDKVSRLQREIERLKAENAALRERLAEGQPTATGGQT